jgi:hypothetical protein
MTKLEIDEIVEGRSQEVLKAHEEILKLQKDKSLVLNTGHEELDKFLIGGLNNKMIFIGSRPSMGKTHHCQSIINNLLNPAINPNQRIKILRMNLEMPTQALLLRELKIGLGRSMSDILSESFKEEDKPKVTSIVNKLRDKRITNFSTSVEGGDLEYLLEKFIKNVDSLDLDSEIKTKKVVLVDHLHIYSDKTSIDSVLKICNQFKMKDPNLSFIFYFQFNRITEEMWRESKEKKVNPKNMLPNSGHIYLTDLLMQYADIVMGMVIPQVVDLDEFVAVYKDRNAHLKEHFVEDNPDNSFARLKGRNRIYYNFIKIRMVDSFDDPRVYCTVLDPSQESYISKLYKPESVTESIDIPFFKKEPTKMVDDVTFEPPAPKLASPEEAFGSTFSSPESFSFTQPSEDDDDKPF